ncbi:MAG TPA: hypothetical protein VHC21_03075 [Candidatus Saccharimonadales bacterium]|nr:hypothetical protein [Candidatus Saccharimonadales bacterium]
MGNSIESGNYAHEQESMERAQEALSRMKAIFDNCDESVLVTAFEAEGQWEEDPYTYYRTRTSFLETSAGPIAVEKCYGTTRRWSGQGLLGILHVRGEWENEEAKVLHYSVITDKPVYGGRELARVQTDPQYIKYSGSGKLLGGVSSVGYSGDTGERDQHIIYLLEEMSDSLPVRRAAAA